MTNVADQLVDLSFLHKEVVFLVAEHRVQNRGKVVHTLSDIVLDDLACCKHVHVSDKARRRTVPEHQGHLSCTSGPEEVSFCLLLYSVQLLAG